MALKYQQRRNSTRKRNGGKLYLLNSPVLTAFGTFTYRKIDKQMAFEILRSHNFLFESAVGHESTAAFMSKLLGVHVPARRKTITMRVGDIAIVLHVKKRLKEGQVLKEEELLKTPHDLGLLIRTA